MNTTPFKISDDVISYLLLNSSFIPNLGLFHGKMGIVLFFAHYGRSTGDHLYDDFAGELLEEIYEDIPVNLAIDLENGLCGIGWGIEYLVRNKFMEGNTDLILEDIDRKVMERAPHRITDLSFRKGLGGILFYALARLTSPRETGTIPFDAQYISELRSAAETAAFTPDDQLPEQLLYHFFEAIEGRISYFYNIALPPLLFAGTPNIDTDIETLPLGIEKGLTARCFKEIL